MFVVCKNNSFGNFRYGNLTIGKKYEVIEIVPNFKISFCDDANQKMTFRIYENDENFILLNEQRKLKINKICG